MNQVTKEFKTTSGDRPLDDQVNDFIDEYATENIGHVEVAGVYPFVKSYSMEPGTTATYTLVVFDMIPPSEFAVKLAQLEQKRTSYGK